MSTYAFIDGAYVIKLMEDEGIAIFGEPLRFSPEKFSLYKCDKCFFYDALPDEIDTLDHNQVERERILNQLSTKAGFHVREGRLKRRKGKGTVAQQKMVDVQLAVDALKHAAQGTYEKAVIVAGDSDFVPLVEALVDLGRFVEVRGGQLNTSGELLRAADSNEPIHLRTMLMWSSNGFVAPEEHRVLGAKGVPLASIKGAYELFQQKAHFELNLIPEHRMFRCGSLSVLSRYVKRYYGADIPAEE